MKMKFKLLKKLMTVGFASYLALAPIKAKAQEIRDPTQEQKKIEVAIAIKSEQGFSGRIWRHHPVPVVQANGSLELELPAIGAVGLEGFTWGCYDYESHSGEVDIGFKMTKKISETITIGAEADVYSYKIRESGNPVYVYFMSASFIKNNFGANASFDFRNLRKYELSASYTVPVHKKLNYKVKIYLRDSYTFGKCGDLVHTISIDNLLKNIGLYANLKLMKAFENLPGETGKHKIIPLLEVGLRYQL